MTVRSVKDLMLILKIISTFYTLQFLSLPSLSVSREIMLAHRLKVFARLCRFFKTPVGSPSAELPFLHGGKV